MQEEQTTMEKTMQTDATMDYITSRIDAIMAEATYLREALETARNSRMDRSVSEAIHARERTNQMILELLHKMYEDARYIGQPPSEQAREYRAIMNSLRGYPNRDFALTIFDRIYGDKYPKPGYVPPKES